MMNDKLAIRSGQRNVNRFCGCTSKMQMYQSKNRKAQRLMPPPGAPGAQPTIFGMEVRFPFRAPTIRRPAPRRNGFPSMAFPAPATRLRS